MLAIKCGKLIPVTAPVIENGRLLVDGGKITAIGGPEMPIPADANVIDVSDKWVYPGLIDAASYLGITIEPYADVMNMGAGRNDLSDPVLPNVSVADAYNPFNKNIERVRRSGVTSCFTSMGPSGVIDGIGAAFKLGRGVSAGELLLSGSEQLCCNISDVPLMSFGAKQRAPFTRAGLADMLRDTLSQAQARLYIENPTPNRKLDALLPALRGEMTVRFACDLAYDIDTAVRIGEEFKLKYMIVGAVEGAKVLPQLLKGKTPVIIKPFRGYYEMSGYDYDDRLAAKAEESGLDFALTMNGVTDTEQLPFMSGLAVANGVSPQRALEAITIRAARFLGQDGRIGSLEVGKDADIAVFNGDALLNYSRCVMSFVNGEQVYAE